MSFAQTVLAAPGFSLRLPQPALARQGGPRSTAKSLRRRQPGSRAVAAVAGCAGRDVVGRLASSYSAVVARLTGADYVGVIEGCPGPGDRGVAIVALLKSDNVVGRFAACDGAVVTARAGPDHGRMIDA